MISQTEVVYPLLNQKAHFYSDSSELPGSHSREQSCVFSMPWLQSLVSLGSPVRFQVASSLPLVDSPVAAASLPLLSRTSSSHWDIPEGNSRATALCRLAASVWTIFLDGWAAPLSGGCLYSCFLCCQGGTGGSSHSAWGTRWKGCSR